MKSSLLVILLMSFMAPLAFADNSSAREDLLLKVNTGALLEMKFNSLMAEKQILEQKIGAHQTYFANDPNMVMALRSLVMLGKQIVSGEAAKDFIAVSEQDMKIRARIAKIAKVSKTVAVIYVSETFKNSEFAIEFARIDKLTDAQAFADFKLLIRLLITKTREIDLIRSLVKERQELITALRN